MPRLYCMPYCKFCNTGTLFFKTFDVLFQKKRIFAPKLLHKRVKYDPKLLHKTAKYDPKI